MMYDDTFYLDEAQIAYDSARIVIPWLANNYPVGHRTIDIGCGTGEWVAAALDYLAGEALGIDLYAPNLADIPRLHMDITGGIDCTGWDLAICLEVAEHLPAESAEPLVAGLAKARYVLFSAATPGQPGIGHINCQPHQYWHDLFATHSMVYTHIGPSFPTIADFYQRNMFLYEHS